VVLCYLAAVSAASQDPAEIADAIPDLTSPSGDQFNWQQLPDAISAAQDGTDIDYEGASGPIDLDANGDASAGFYDIYKYQGGDYRTIDQVAVDTGK
jgi:branched-chain amino acid transport system substrate-binding protein